MNHQKPALIDQEGKPSSCTPRPEDRLARKTGRLHWGAGRPSPRHGSWSPWIRVRRVDALEGSEEQLQLCPNGPLAVFSRLIGPETGTARDKRPGGKRCEVVREVRAELHAGVDEPVPANREPVVLGGIRANRGIEIHVLVANERLDRLGDEVPALNRHAPRIRVATRIRRVDVGPDARDKQACPAHVPGEVAGDAVDLGAVYIGTEILIRPLRDRGNTGHHARVTSPLAAEVLELTPIARDLVFGSSGERVIRRRAIPVCVLAIESRRPEAARSDAITRPGPGSEGISLVAQLDALGVPLIEILVDDRPFHGQLLRARHEFFSHPRRLELPDFDRQTAVEFLLHITIFEKEVPSGPRESALDLVGPRLIENVS